MDSQPVVERWHFGACFCKLQLKNIHQSLVTISRLFHSAGHPTGESQCLSHTSSKVRRKKKWKVEFGDRKKWCWIDLKDRKLEREKFLAVGAACRAINPDLLQEKRTICSFGFSAEGALIPACAVLPCRRTGPDCIALCLLRWRNVAV